VKKYVGMIIGVVAGLILGWLTTQWSRGGLSDAADFQRGLAVPLGMIGYAVGAMLERRSIPGSSVSNTDQNGDTDEKFLEQLRKEAKLNSGKE
jgi:hypothetical protein